MLQAVKVTAKERRRAVRGEVADRVLNAVYHAAIAAALAAHGQRITTKTRVSLLKDRDWLARRPWVDDETRELARRAGAKLAGSARTNREVP